MDGRLVPIPVVQSEDVFNPITGELRYVLVTYRIFHGKDDSSLLWTHVPRYPDISYITRINGSFYISIGEDELYPCEVVW